MRLIRMTLVMALLGPISACLVTTESGGRTRAPGPGEPSGASVSGRIVDARTRQPISQAAVDILRVEDHKVLTTASTAPDGTFRTDDVQPGRYIINIRRNGYDLQSHQGYDLRPGTTELNVELQPK